MLNSRDGEIAEVFEGRLHKTEAIFKKIAVAVMQLEEPQNRWLDLFDKLGRKEKKKKEF